MTRPTPDPEFDVPADWSPGARCRYCGRPFAAERARDLHRGEVHPDRCTAAELDAYEAALAAERDDLFYFHMRTVVALSVLYAATVLVYMVALGGGFL
ncbi:MAG: DNA-binding protein [Haloferacaceae archaeon]